MLENVHKPVSRYCPMGVKPQNCDVCIRFTIVPIVNIKLTIVINSKRMSEPFALVMLKVQPYKWS